MPLALHGRHEPSRMRTRIRVFQAIPVDMTGDARGIGTLCVMARCTAFNVAPSELGMQSAPRADSIRLEIRLLVRQRKELQLVHVSSSHVTGGAEIFGVMARRAFGRPSGRLNTVREAEIQIMDLFQRHSLRAVIGGEPGRPGGNEVPADRARAE